MNYEQSNLGKLAGMYEVSRFSEPSPSLAEECMNLEGRDMGELTGAHGVSRLLELPSHREQALIRAHCDDGGGHYESYHQEDDEDTDQIYDQERLLEQWKSESLVIDYADEEEDWDVYDDEDDEDRHYESYHQGPDEDDEDTDSDDHWDDERDIYWS